MKELIINLYKRGLNEKQIKDELLLYGYKEKGINKAFKDFTNTFTTPKQIFDL